MRKKAIMSCIMCLLLTLCLAATAHAQISLGVYVGQGEIGAEEVSDAFFIEDSCVIEFFINSLDEDAAITVDLIDIEKNETIVSYFFNFDGNGQFIINEGFYQIAVVVAAGSGDVSYEIEFFISDPYAQIAEDETPLGMKQIDLAAGYTPLGPVNPQTSDTGVFGLIILTTSLGVILTAVAARMVYIKRKVV